MCADLHRVRSAIPKTLAKRLAGINFPCFLPCGARGPPRVESHASLYFSAGILCSVYPCKKKMIILCFLRGRVSSGGHAVAIYSQGVSLLSLPRKVEKCPCPWFLSDCNQLLLMKHTTRNLEARFLNPLVASNVSDGANCNQKVKH